MSDKMKALNILLIDDSKEYCESLMHRARDSRILIDSFQNLEEGVAALEETYKYKGVILDGRCFISPGQGIPTDKFLYHALRKIDRIMTNQERYIPVIVNSAYVNELEHMLPNDIKCFDKSEDNEAMFSFIKSEIDRTEEIQIRNKFEKPFQVFAKGYLSDDLEHRLIKIISEMQSNDTAVIESCLGKVRMLMEAIFIKMNQTNKEVVPDKFFKVKGIHCRGIIKHLKGYPGELSTGLWGPTSTQYQPKYISDLLFNAYAISSDEGAHLSENRPTKYLTMNVVYGLLECLTWFGRWMEEQTS